MRHFAYGFGGLAAAAALACSSSGPSTGSSASTGNAMSGSTGAGSGSSETGTSGASTTSGASGTSSGGGVNVGSGMINGTGSGSTTSTGTGSTSAGANSAGSSTGGSIGESGSSGMMASDGGANDATAGSPTSGEAGAGCAASGYALCDDFEGAEAGATGSAWTIDTAGGYTVETVTTMAHSGTHSVHVMAKGVSGHGYIVETKTFPATDFWGRAYLLLQAPPSGHEVFLAFDGNNDEQVRVLNDLGSGKIATNRRSDDHSMQSSQAYPMGTWACYEWHETPTELHLYFQGKELTDADEMWTEATLTLLRIGFERFDTGTGGDIYIDDVAVSSTQIGCN
jgi:hypothetical protein